MKTVHLHPDLRNLLPGFQLGVLQYANVSIAETPAPLQQELDRLAQELRSSCTSEQLTQIKGVSEWRQAFKTIGMDPSRYRPSSEALLRRVLQDKPLFPIHTAVEVNNYCSMMYALPFGIYNLAALEGDIVCRLGQANEAYLGLNGRETSFADKLLTADGKGPFDSPIVDSQRTKVTEDATDLLQIIYVYPAYADSVDALLRDVAELFTRWNGGHIGNMYIVD